MNLANMRSSSFRLLIGIISLFLVACGDNTQTNNEPQGKVFNISQYVGTYAGTWTNNTTGATGAAKLIITADSKTNVATLTLDFDGKYLGIDNPPATTLTGTYDSKGALVKGKSDLFGDYDVTIDVDGKIVGIMKNIAGGAIPEMTYTGVITDTKLDADYVVSFADGNTANSILRMQKSSNTGNNPY
jgi:hypothetical protein